MVLTAEATGLVLEEADSRIDAVDWLATATGLILATKLDAPALKAWTDGEATVVLDVSYAVLVEVTVDEM